MQLLIVKLRLPLALATLILTAACTGCARRNILFESKRDLTPCDEYGGKVSMAMRAEPVTRDKGIMPHGLVMPVASVRERSTHSIARDSILQGQRRRVRNLPNRLAERRSEAVREGHVGHNGSGDEGDSTQQ